MQNDPTSDGLLADLRGTNEPTDAPPISALLVEDGEIDAVIVRSSLESSDALYDLQHATTLNDAVGQLSANSAIRVVILDLNLPDSEGLATFEALSEKFPTVPFVILTSQDDMATAAEAVAHGAQDFVPKSQLNPELLTRSLQYAIERQARREAEHQNQRIQAELEAARNIQQMMLPQAPPEIAGLDVAAICTPAEICGGDFFDYFASHDVSQLTWDFVLGDVSSHGFGPALITVGARRALRMSSKLNHDPGEVLTLANREISEDTAGNHFITLFYAKIDPHQRTFTYSSAGQPVWIVTASGETVELQCDGLPLGIMDDMEYETVETRKLNPGDIIVMPTDGIYEAMPSGGKLFGVEAMLRTVAEHRHASADEIRSAVIQRVVSYCNPDAPQDDLTLVILKVR